MAEAPKPKDTPQLCSFLRLVNSYHRFLPNLSTLLHPLHQQLQKGHTWTWAKAWKKAFMEVKTLIASDVLTHYDPNRSPRLAGDASPYGHGSVLSHVMEDGEE